MYSGLSRRIKSEGHRRTLDTPDELLASSSEAAACIKKREDQLRRTARDLHAQGSQRVEVDGEIFEHLFSFKRDIKIEIKLNCKR